MAVATRAVSFLWGISEATFFFFVPDIWLTRIALKNPKEAYINIAIATAGAICGGTIIYFLALFFFHEVQTFLAEIPAISPQMIHETEIQIHTSGLGLAMLKGMGSGIPYKIYAAWAGKLQFPFASFLILSVAARTLRFSLAVCATHLAAHTLKLKLSFGCIYGLYAFFWFSLYASYFYIFGF